MQFIHYQHHNALIAYELSALILSRVNAFQLRSELINQANGEPLLFTVMYRGMIKHVRLLLLNGADPFLKDAMGHTALFAPLCNQNLDRRIQLDTINSFLQNLTPFKRELLFYKNNQSLIHSYGLLIDNDPLLKTLTSFGANFYIQNERGQNILHYWSVFSFKMNPQLEQNIIRLIEYTYMQEQKLSEKERKIEFRKQKDNDGK